MKMLGGYRKERERAKAEMPGRDSGASENSSRLKSRSEKISRVPENGTLMPERVKKVRSNSFRIGQALAGDAKKMLAAKKKLAKDRRRRKVKYVGVVSLFCIIGAVGVVLAINFTLSKKAEREAEELAASLIPEEEPVTRIVDENVSTSVSRRVKDFVIDLEQDLIQTPYVIDHVILPAQKARELRIYVTDKPGYYKMTLDRGSAVQAEDMVRMIKYLEEKEITPEYVDLRVEGRAYYK